MVIPPYPRGILEKEVTRTSDTIMPFHAAERLCGILLKYDFPSMLFGNDTLSSAKRK
jgi:hypothetical protein